MNKTLFKLSFPHFQSMTKNKFKIRMEQINYNNNNKFNKTILIRSNNKFCPLKITNFNKIKSNLSSINNPISLIRMLCLLNKIRNNINISNNLINKYYNHHIKTKWINSFSLSIICNLHSKILKFCNNSLNLFSNQFQSNNLICSNQTNQFK